MEIFFVNKWLVLYSTNILLVGQPLSYNGTVYLSKDGKMQYKANVVDKKGFAYATFKDGLMYNGWGVLDVVSGYNSSNGADSDVMFAAGFLEGALTYRYIDKCNYYIA